MQELANIVTHSTKSESFIGLQTGEYAEYFVTHLNLVVCLQINLKNSANGGIMKPKEVCVFYTGMNAMLNTQATKT